MNKRCVAVDFWEEHCIECGAPACYATCEKYRRGAGGLCRRIEHGKFNVWGKLELFWQGRVVRPWVKWLLEGVFSLVGLFLLASGRGFAFRGLRRRVTRRFGRRMAVTGWVIECIAEEDETLMATIVNGSKEDLFIRRLDVKKGHNRFFFSLSNIPSGVFFRISSVEGTKGCVEFTRLEVETNPATLMPAEFVKCVIWDLDNTLWDGILADVGPDVLLRKEVFEVIKQLDQRGIVNSICSKNNFDEAWAQVRKFGLAEYFVFPRINWAPKSENIQKIARDINIGMNALAFVDDSEHERGEVSELLPMVRVYEEKAINDILASHEFNPPTSVESANRRQSYLAEMRRRKDEDKDDGDHQSFIRKCEIELSCRNVGDETTRCRCWELVNRTNQLTLAARRYTEEDFRELLKTAECQAIKCRDKYGDYGIVGFIAFDGACVREFVMSCRVAKKYCEQSILLAIARKLRSAGFSQLTADVVSTGRNGALIEAFDAMPFEKTQDGNKISYCLSLDKNFDDLYCNKVMM